MEHKKVLRFFEIMGYIFMSISIIEIAFVISLSFTAFDNLVGSPILMSEFIFSTDYISLTGAVLWLFLIISMVCFLIAGFFMFKTARSKKIESASSAKLIIIFGMVLLLGAFVKMDLLVLLGKTDITTLSGPISFQSALYDFDITPIMPAVYWIFFISANCSFLIGALVITAIGIKWSLLIEQSETTQ